MATNHIAIMRSSARMAQQQRAADLQLQETESGKSSTISEMNTDDNNLHQRLSVVSIGSSFDGDSLRKSADSSKNPPSQPYKQDKSKVTTKAIPKLMAAPLAPILTQSDIEVSVDEELNQLNTLSKLEQRWREITINFDAILHHLQKCSDQVTEASVNCLGSLVGSIETICDKVDAELKGLYMLMSKCDELTTKLSVASSFRDEIKSLKKSVETLENLYKLRPQPTLIRQQSNT